MGRCLHQPLLLHFFLESSVTALLVLFDQQRGVVVGVMWPRLVIGRARASIVARDAVRGQPNLLSTTC